MKLIIATIIISFFGLCSVFADNDTKSLTEIYIDGDYEGLKTLIAKNVNLDKPDYDGKTALILAAYDGNEEIVELLIENKAEVNIVDEDGRTALIYAIYDGNEDIVHLLIENDAKVNVIDNDGMTPLIYAIFEGNNEIVELLIQNRADLFVSDNDGRTALIWASMEGHEKIARLIIGKIAEAEVKKANSDGKVSEDEEDYIAEVITNYVNIADDYGKTALNWAAQEGYTDIVELLIKNKSKNDVSE